jgi:hypothetical protein
MSSVAKTAYVSPITIADRPLAIQVLKEKIGFDDASATTFFDKMLLNFSVEKLQATAKAEGRKEWAQPGINRLVNKVMDITDLIVSRRPPRKTEFDNQVAAEVEKMSVQDSKDNKDATNISRDILASTQTKDVQDLAFTSRCTTCDKTLGNIYVAIKCDSCKVRIPYCAESCQKIHFPLHQKDCNVATKS